MLLTSEFNGLCLIREDVELLGAGCDSVEGGESEEAANREGFSVDLTVDIADPDGACDC